MSESATGLLCLKRATERPVDLSTADGCARELLRWRRLIEKFKGTSLEGFGTDTLVILQTRTRAFRVHEAARAEITRYALDLPPPIVAGLIYYTGFVVQLHNLKTGVLTGKDLITRDGATVLICQLNLQWFYQTLIWRAEQEGEDRQQIADCFAGIKRASHDAILYLPLEDLRLGRDEVRLALKTVRGEIKRRAGI